MKGSCVWYVKWIKHEKQVAEGSEEQTGVEEEAVWEQSSITGAAP